MLHPPVALVAVHALLAPGVLQGLDFLVEVPVGAFLGLVTEGERVSTEILHVVSIHTH